MIGRLGLTSKHEEYFDEKAMASVEDLDEEEKLKQFQEKLARHENSLNVHSQIKFYRNESVVIRDKSIHYYKDKVWHPGRLYITNYRLLFQPAVISSYENVPKADFVDVALTMIHKVEKIGGKTTKTDHGYAMKVYAKNLKILKFSFIPDSRSKRGKIGRLLRADIPIRKFFAFTYQKSDFSQGTGIIDGWKLYNSQREFGFRQRIIMDMEKKELDYFYEQQKEEHNFRVKRNLLNSWLVTDPPDPCIKKWRVCLVNKNFEFSKTYPREFIVPATMTDEEVKAVAPFRSKARIPVLSWCNNRGGAALVRCAQPLVGVNITRKTFVDDQRMMENIILTNPQNNSLMIVDLRPKLNADANKIFKGAGYEKNYKNCEIRFMGIENIHAMRNSFSKLMEVCHATQGIDLQFQSSVEATKWLEHIRLTLRASIFCVMTIEREKQTVLVHCSDGWDRTSQVVSLAQVMLDPYYRTLEGQMVLIDKDWISFGHQFHKRTGPGSKLFFSDDRGPIFFQYLECLYQLMRQHPAAFEFTDKFLLDMMDEVYNCRFGTFLYDYEKVRRSKEILLESNTESLWTEMLKNYKQYLNPLYNREISSTIIPDIRSAHIQLWTNYWLRHIDPPATKLFTPRMVQFPFHEHYLFHKQFPNPEESMKQAGDRLVEELNSLRDYKQKMDSRNEKTISIFQEEIRKLAHENERKKEELKEYKANYHNDTQTLIKLCNKQKNDLRKLSMKDNEEDGEVRNDDDSELFSLLQRLDKYSPEKIREVMEKRFENLQKVFQFQTMKEKHSDTEENTTEETAEEELKEE